MNKQKGFTLIELLVVIAIIGILATVVLASLNSARGKAKDAKIKAQLQSMHPAAIMFYDDYNNYNDDGDSHTVCTGPLNDMVNSANATCAADADSWSAIATLNDGTTKWCVDSSGYTGEATAADANGCTHS